MRAIDHYVEGERVLDLIDVSNLQPGDLARVVIARAALAQAAAVITEGSTYDPAEMFGPE